MSGPVASPSYTVRAEPLGREDRGFGLRDAATLAVILAACVLPLLIGLGGRDTTHTMENLAVFSSQETWLRMHGWHDLPAEPGAWAMPSRNGEPRLRKPPGVVWANLLAWADLRPGEPGATPADLLHRARLVSVAMGLLLIAGVYGVGRNLGDRQTAVIAALVAGTMIFTQKQARYASYDIYMAAWLAVATAAAPLRGFFPGHDGESTPARDAARWGLAGVAVGVAWMCKGPLAVAVFALAVAAVAAAAWRGAAARRAAAGLAVSLAAACLVALPWHAWAASHSPLWEAVAREARHTAQKSDPLYTHLQIFALVFPWCVWLIGGLFLPWMRLAGARRRQALAAFGWFVAILVVFTIPSARQPRYILPVVPAAAVLIAQLWRWHQELADRGEEDPGGAALRLPHALLLIGGALWFAPFALMQDELVAWGLFEQPELGEMFVPGVLLASAIMLLSGGIAAWLTLRPRKRPAEAAFWTGVWMLAFSSAWWFGYSRAPDGEHPVRPHAERVAEWTAGAPVRSFITPDLDEAINEELLFYGQRVMPRLDAAGVAAFAAELAAAGEVGFVVAPVGEPRDAVMQGLGARAVATFREDHDRDAALWRLGDPGEPDRRNGR